MKNHYKWIETLPSYYLPKGHVYVDSKMIFPWLIVLVSWDKVLYEMNKVCLNLQMVKVCPTMFGVLRCCTFILLWKRVID